MTSSFRGKGKPKKSKSANSEPSPLEARQRELLDQQKKVQEQMEALQRAITDAPKRGRNAQGGRAPSAYAPAPGDTRYPPQFRHSATLADKRFEDAPPVRRAKSKRMLRSERRAAQVQTLALLVVLVAVVIWAIHWLVG